MYLYSNSCLTDVDLELADDCQYWLEGVILVSDNTIVKWSSLLSRNHPQSPVRISRG